MCRCMCIYIYACVSICVCIGICMCNYMYMQISTKVTFGYSWGCYIRSVNKDDNGTRTTKVAGFCAQHDEIKTPPTALS